MSATFDSGRRAAIEEVSEAVVQYVACVKEGREVDPWEEWLPRFLDNLAENDQPHIPRDAFDDGWDAAIQDTRGMVALYIHALTRGGTIDPWEVWLPRFLNTLGEQNKPTDALAHMTPASELVQ
jgi:hypothetical protein